MLLSCCCWILLSPTVMLLLDVVITHSIESTKSGSHHICEPAAFHCRPLWRGPEEQCCRQHGGVVHVLAFGLLVLWHCGMALHACRPCGRGSVEGSTGVQWHQCIRASGASTSVLLCYPQCLCICCNSICQYLLLSVCVEQSHNESRTCPGQSCTEYRTQFQSNHNRILVSAA